MLRLPRPACLLLLAMALSAAPAVAGGARGASDSWTRLELPPRVRAGETVRIALPAIPADVEEMEVLLSLDGGATYPVRITRDALAWGSFVRWQVPNRAARSAAVRLRYRREGREVDGRASAPFEIVADASRPPDLRLPLDRDPAAELDRQGFGLAGRLDADRTASLAAGGESAAEPPPSSVAPCQPGQGRPCVTTPAPGPSAPRAPHHPRETFRPLRN